MKQRILIVILAILLIASFLFWDRKIASVKQEINFNKIELDSLKSKLSNTKYNYGLALAKTNCLSCHRFKFATDNHLEGIVQRLGEKYLSLYLTKQDSLINVHDTYAVSVKERFGNLGNSHNFNFSQNDLEALFEFMK